VALVIGNSAYQHVGRLPNPVNDAAAVAALFKSAGFDVVQPRSDLGVAAMRRAVGDFADVARDSDIAVIYFAGHGIEVDGARGRTSPGACRRFWFGNDENVLCQYGNGSCNVKGTSPAGKYKPNAFGLYDMAGNAWQWTEDCSHDNYGGAPTDGSAWTSQGCSRRVFRGGMWNNLPWFLRAAARSGDSDTKADRAVGFRLARTLTP
jgi:hypothetical protein